MTIPSQSYCFSGFVTLYFYLLVSLILHTLASPMFNSCAHDQRDALLEFKQEFLVNESSSNPLLSSWNKSSNCCSWEGVICHLNSSQVISLDLRSIPLNNSLKTNSGLFKLQHLRSLILIGCNLYGEIPSSLGNLSHLTYLNLWGNYLVGKVPASLGNLPYLTDLNLYENHLVGEVPASIGNLTQLRHLSLGRNNLSGYIPVSFVNLMELSRLVISDNHFKGEIFSLILLNLTTSLSELFISNNLFKSMPDMSGFHNLVKFAASGNSFFGPFPTSLFTISSLDVVNLGGNQLKGPIEFKNISLSSNLRALYLWENKLDGPIHKSISNFPNLQYLYLSGNNFNGPIPRSISKLANLGVLDISNNNLIGSIPRSNIANLRFLDLSNNKLEGEIPSWLGGVSTLMLSRNSFSSFEESFEALDSTQFETLDLSSNSFREPLPHWICKSASLKLLDLSNNNFSGSIPHCLRNTGVLLRMLNLQNNNLSGIHPDAFFNATSLVAVDVSNNQLEGKLPESLINCTSLEILNVESNRIKDKFPSWLGSLPSLNVMILRSNEFYGPLYHPHMSIGFQSLKIIDVSHNHFNGTLPPFYFSNWRKMINSTEEDGRMYMDHPLYAPQVYHIPIDMVNKGVDMEFPLIRKDFKVIDFSGNNFCGKIPESIGLLKGLRLLNLSGNGFTSNIPQSLANLTNLEALDLSRNQLSGQIPRDLGSLSFLSVMNFSRNKLEGPVPRGTQFQIQNCSAFMDNSKLYGLEDICGETHVPNPTSQESEDLSDSGEQVISWIAAAIAYGPGIFCGLVIGHIFSTHIHKWFL